NSLMIALWEGGLQPAIGRLLRCMSSGCRIDKRQQFPSTAQRLEGVPMHKKRGAPQKSRHRDQKRRWPAGKGWDTAGYQRKSRPQKA
ncbi:MAG TPA: hypothetical protein VKR06_30945, partial [Ktedonosporobacter sp.]|nr:hypothetical protein [Ktedonosporobacter sp.]